MLVSDLLDELHRFSTPSFLGTTSAGGTTTTVITTSNDILSRPAGFFNGWFVEILTGTQAGQWRQVSSHAVSGGVATLTVVNAFQGAIQAAVDFEVNIFDPGWDMDGLRLGLQSLNNIAPRQISEIFRAGNLVRNGDFALWRGAAGAGTLPSLISGVHTGGMATLVVAASNANLNSKAAADYICDGVADEVQIQAALDALPASGGRVCLTEGIFNLSSTGATGRISLASNQELVGRGMGVTRLQLTPGGAVAGQSIISNSDRVSGTNTKIAIRDLSLDGDFANQAGAEFRGIDLISGSGYVIEEVELLNIPMGAIYLGGTISRVKILNSIITNTGGIISWPGTNTTDVMISGCSIDSSGRGGDAIGLLSTTNQDLRILGNYLKVGQQPITVQCIGIEVWGLQRAIISGNNIVGDNSTKAWGISAIGGGAASLIANNFILNCHGYSIEVGGGAIVIAGNNIHHCGTAILNTVGETAFVNNVVTNGPAVAGGSLLTIWATGTNHILVQGNIFGRGAGGQLVYVATDVAYLDILDNFFISLNQANLIGLNMESPTAVNIRNNTFEGFYIAGDACISAGGGSGTIIGNHFQAATTYLQGNLAGYVIKRNQGYVTESSGATSVADGGTINHGLSATPTRARVTPSVAGEMAAVTALGATTLTVALKKHDGSAGTTQTVYWEAEV